jgi:tetratricopeptide (TPR) repeat protein
MKWSSTIAGCVLLSVYLYVPKLQAKSENETAAYSQIVLPFPAERPFTYEWMKATNTLVLQFPKSSPAELDAINNYDEKLVRRVLVKDQGAEGTEIKLVLKNKSVRAVVTSLNDPFRVTIDLFDKTYTEAKDPESGLPLTSGRMGTELLNADGELWQSSSAPSTPIATGGKQAGGVQADGGRTKRRLLQAMPDEIDSPNELKAAISKIPPGLGKGWATYPPYIYRMQLAPYEGREAPSGELSPLQIKAVSTATAMADYAAKLFDFGHEGRALAAYQQVLQHDPGVFDHDALHLWKFAETHLGQGNLTLSQGYYQTLIEKHPDSMMARFARLRKIDVQALKAIADDDKPRLVKLAAEMSSIPTRDNAELMAMIAIRNVWWNDTAIDQKLRTTLPTCNEDSQVTLTKLAPRIESPRTAYLASVLVATRLTNKNTAWQNDYAKWLSTFFTRYKGAQNSDERESLSQATRSRIAQQIHTLFADGKFTDVTAIYEQLPPEMKSIAKDPTTSWQLAESYRSIGQQNQSIKFYAGAAKANGAVDQFKSNFWLAILATNHVSELKANTANQATIRSLESDAKRADIAMSDLWRKLKADEKSVLMTALGAPMQDSAASDARLRTPPKIILEQYKSVLSSNAPKITGTSGTSKTDWLGNFSPSGATVKLLDDLGRKFAQLGMPAERRQSIELMKLLKPEHIAQDKEAAKLWASELTKLAEEHRKADEFLDAGELYTLVGDSTAVTEARAENLYKGGLLLFRAGKKQDAVKALEKAKGDTANLFYSKLATERLDQISTK